MSVSQAEEIAAGGALALGLASYWLWAARTGAHEATLRWRARRRARMAEAAAVEASLDEPVFAPERLRAAVDEVLAVAAEAWSTGGSLPERPDARLITAWARSIAAALGGEARLSARPPKVEFLRVVNRPGEVEDRVTVRVRLRLRRAHHALIDAREVTIDQRWTLGRVGELWTLRSVENGPLDGAVLQGRLIPGEWLDEDRLREQALVEIADAPPRGARLAELVPEGVAVSQQLSELSQLDGRFDPALLHAVLRHLVEAWEEATTGSSEPLHELCGEAAVRELRHPAVSRRALTFVVSDANLDAWEPIAVDAAAEHPQVHVGVSITAVRYLIDSTSGQHVAGSREIEHHLSLLWTLALFDIERNPWRLLASTNPALEIPGALDERPDRTSAQPLDGETIERRAAEVADKLHALSGIAAPAATPATSTTPDSAHSSRSPTLRALATLIARISRRPNDDGAHER